MSSVVNFSQRLGFKGYPDLKYSVGDSLARGDGGDDNGAPASTESPHPHAALAEGLWRAKAEAEEETRLINPPENIDAIADAIRGRSAEHTSELQSLIRISNAVICLKTK